MRVAKHTRHNIALMQALRFVHMNIYEDISLEEVSSYVGLSPYYFHKLFTRYTGEAFKSYIRRIRLQNAAFRLRVEPSKIIDIAFDSGFHTHESFSRAFTKRFNTLPSAYKKALPSTTFRASLRDFTIEYFQATTCQYKSHVGAYEDVLTPEYSGSLWQQLACEHTPKSLLNHELYGVSYDNPSIVQGKDIRYDACIALSDMQPTHPTLTLKAGQYLTVKHVDSTQYLSQSYLYLIYDYLPHHQLKIDYNEPPFEQYHLQNNSGEICISYVTIYIPLLAQ